MSAHEDLRKLLASREVRHLEITDLERIERFRRAGYGGAAADSLTTLGVRNTVFSDRFRPLRQGMQLVGRALPIKLHSLVEDRSQEWQAEMEKEWETKGGPPQKTKMREVAAHAPGETP